MLTLPEPIIVLTDEFDSDGEISFVGIHRPLESQRVRCVAPLIIISPWAKTC
jgi:hypothetical protein